jgi:hypothetical protein
MPTLDESSHFVPAQRLPKIEGSTPFREVYVQLYDAGCGGFLMTEEGRVRGYVKGYALAEDVIEQARGDAGRLRELTNMPISRVVSVINKSAALITVPHTPVDWASDEQLLLDQPERVFNVKAADDTIGWFLNHETVRETATTIPVFVCTRGHKNTDPDHGTCSYCPALLEEAKKADAQP